MKISSFSSKLLIIFSTYAWGKGGGGIYFYEKNLLTIESLKIFFKEYYVLYIDICLQI